MQEEGDMNIEVWTLFKNDDEDHDKKKGEQGREGREDSCGPTCLDLDKISTEVESKSENIEKRDQNERENQRKERTNGHDIMECQLNRREQVSVDIASSVDANTFY